MESSSVEHAAWAAMKARCCNPNHISYGRYKKLKVTVCPRWVNSYSTFLKDMGRRPSPKHSLDRRDNLQGYSKDNCRWATTKQQARNRSSNKPVRYLGRTMLLVEWVEFLDLQSRLGVSAKLLHSRIYGNSWPLAKAFTQPAIQKFLIAGVLRTPVECSVYWGVSISTARRRLKNGKK